jgi:FHS family Na+ dependent glucose MFS transporter 1
VARDDRWPKALGYSGGFVAVGLATAVLGPTLPGLAERTQSQLGQASVLFTALSLGYLVGSLWGGRLYDRVPGHPVMVGALAIMAATLAAAPAIPQFWVLAATLLILGVAASTMDVGGNTLLVWVYGQQVGPYMNALHFFFGLGSLLSPIVVAQAIMLSGDIAWAYWALALLVIPATLWLLRVPSPRAPADPAGNASDAQPPKTQERLLLALIVLLFVLYVGAEAGFGGWIYTYAVTLDLSDETTAAYLTSAFWGALTMGRLLAVPIAARVHPRWILLVDLGGCLASVGILLLWPGSPAATWLGTCGLGFAMASIFPSLVSLSERHMAISGRITGWFLAGASLGGMTLPWLMGQFFESLGPRSIMAAIGIDLLAAVAAFAVLMLHTTRRLSLARRLVYNGESHRESEGGRK